MGMGIQIGTFWYYMWSGIYGCRLVDSKYCVMSGVNLDMRVLSVRLKWGVECWAENSRCLCQPKLILA